MTPKQAIRAVVDHIYEREAQDFAENPSDQHIIHALSVLKTTYGTDNDATHLDLRAGLNEMVESYRLREDHIPDDWDWLIDELGRSDEPRPKDKHAYTVILLYPDTIRGSDIETYCVDIDSALHPRDAVQQAQHQCVTDNGWETIKENQEEGYDPDDFAPLYVFNGIAPEITFSHFGGCYGTEDVPSTACALCGAGVYDASEKIACAACRKARCQNSNAA